MVRSRTLVDCDLISNEGIATKMMVLICSVAAYHIVVTAVGNMSRYLPIFFLLWVGNQVIF